MNILEKAKHLLNPGDTLSQRVARGSVWVFAIKGVSEGLKVIRLMVLAAVLAPDDFGLLGMAMLTVSIIAIFTQTGFNAALIQKKEDLHGYLDTAWTISALRGIVLASLMLAGAPLVDIFFETPAAIPIVRVIAISILLDGFSNIGRIYFDKELEFHKKFAYEIGGTVVDLVVAISAALILGSVWALVYGHLAGHATRFVLSYLLHPYRPRPRLDFAKAKELFKFGKWILASTVLIFLVTQGDDIFVGKVLGSTMLGFYLMAYRISNTPATTITHVISKLAFPAYSKLQDNLPKLREAYLKILQITTFISIPLAGGIFILAPDFTQVFLGEKWMPMVPALQFLAIEGLLRSIAATMGEVFKSVGKPQIDTKWQIVRLLVLGASIYPLTTQWELLGVSLAVTLSVLVSGIGSSYSVIKITECGVKNFSRLVGFPLVSGIIMVLLVFALKTCINSTGIWQFFLFVSAGVLTYFTAAYIFDRFFNFKIGLLVKEGLRSLRGI